MKLLLMMMTQRFNKNLYFLEELENNTKRIIASFIVVDEGKCRRKECSLEKNKMK